MYKERLYFAAQHFVASNLLLMLLFLLIRSAEYFLTGLTHSFPEGASYLIVYGYLFDIWYVLVLSTLMFPFYLGIYLLFGSSTKYFLFVVFMFYVLVYIGLIQYYSITMLPLSADFWGYSAGDIKTTINASAGISIGTFLPFIVVLGILFVIYKKVQEIIMPQSLVWAYGSISLVSCIVYFIFTPSASWFTNENRYTFSVNKMAYFNEKSFAFYFENNNNNPERVINIEYPLVHDADTADVLGPFFDSLPAKPNFVFLMIEGLGGTFVGPNARYGGCTPFLDSLAQHSLYWQYFLSTTGRTFGVLPSLFGSLPYSEKGFMETGANMPTHLTLFRLLKDQGYATRYFHGGNTNFDLQDVFLERQGIDFILGESKFPPPPAYQKLPANSGGFSWGYSDGDVFRRSLELFGPDTIKPHLSVYMTLNTHEPFKIPEQEKYLAQLEKIAATKIGQQQDYKQYELELSALLYTDHAIRELMEAYKQRSDYKNTIFIITGDHRMIPVTQINRIDRFHVPFIVFSPMLKRTQMFSSISTHHDVTPTVLSLLQKNTPMRFPQKVHWLGHMIDTIREFHSVENVALMRNKNELIDYIDHDYFLSDNILYHITPKLDLERSDDGGKLSELKEKLAGFKQMNQYVFANNKIYNDSLMKAVKPEFEFTRKEEFMIKIVHADTLPPDEIFFLARKYLFAQNYHMGRVLCEKALLTSPNYTDIRILLGRSYAWAGEFDEARKHFNEAIRRVPDNSDAYTALIDMEIWSEHYTEAIKTADLAYGIFKDKAFLEQKAKAKRIMEN
jgi:lipoteichoic acid synthase